MKPELLKKREQDRENAFNWRKIVRRGLFLSVLLLGAITTFIQTDWSTSLSQ